MRLAAAGGRHSGYVHRRIGRSPSYILPRSLRLRPDIPCWVARTAIVGIGLWQMTVGWNLSAGQGDCLRAATFAKRMPMTLVHGNTTAQVRQRESRLPIAAVRCADQGKENVVLGDGQQ